MLHKPVNGVCRSRARSQGRAFVMRGRFALLLVVALLLSHRFLNAQVLSPPVQLGPTVAALDALHKCGENISRNAGNISADLLDAQQKLYFGLAKGGYSTQFGATAGRSGYQNGGYERSGDWLLTPPPKEYVNDLTHEAQWCLEVANILNTDPARKEAARQVLASIAKDLEIKVKDCKDWGAGRLVTVIA